MHPGVNIEPYPEPARAPDSSRTADPATAGTTSDPAVLGALTDLQASGRDTGGHATATLDGRGRLTDLVLDDLVVADGRRAVERAVLEATSAAADDLDRQREAAAARMLADGDLRLSALTGQLKELSDHADARLRDALQQLRDQTDRIGGSS